MSAPRPQPVVFEPIFKPKPWGGRALAEVFGKHIPDGPVGESWELVSLPGNESVARGGPLAGRSISDFVGLWGDDLLGEAKPVDGGFPLLIKFLDARDDLSVQVHPKPPDDGPPPPGIKHEAWYVIRAEADAKMYIGLADGVGPNDLRAAANTPGMADLLKARPVRVGDCFYLPSGTPHALGGGILVAEVQTPSDTTYRLYDWDRKGLDGKPRTLHIEEGLANVRYDIGEDDVIQPRRSIAGGGEQLVECEAFGLVRLAGRGEQSAIGDAGRMSILIVLRGSGRIDSGDWACAFAAGDVVLVPAACRDARLRPDGPFELLRVTAGGL